ncbi:hypothetical protein PAPHI01_0476 [Pancytospora philotis]|nr:hypothetical protein PAPHI01_0476 [Pancytospora philotis]
MNAETHFLSSEKLSGVTKRKIDPEVARSVQLFTEKIVADIVNRSSVVARFLGTNMITGSEVALVIERDYDYTFKGHIYFDGKHPANPEHISYMAELSRLR